MFNMSSMQGAESGSDVIVIGGRNGKRQDCQESDDFWPCRPQ